MKDRIARIIDDALRRAIVEGRVSVERLPPIILERPRREEHGDFATTIAMVLSRQARCSPRELAGIIVERIDSPMVSRCEIAGPGFINIFVDRAYWWDTLCEILNRGDDYGRVDVGKGRKVQVEFVSANPTGPLHIGHGRGAAVGDSLANILKIAGFDVTKEYYINDTGRQMEILGRSLFLRYRELLGEKVVFPEDHYRGDYIKDIARDMISRYGKKFLSSSEDEVLDRFTHFAMSVILDGIKKDLRDFGVDFDNWYSESSLFERGLVMETIEELRKMGLIYHRDGAVWFRTTDFGDDKDRVLIKADGSTTYFASDIAYHRDKLVRGFSTIVDVWGADHHGYEPRMKALFRALGRDESTLRVIFIQLVSLLRGGEPISMSTRKGEFVTLREVMDEVGRDACRFFFLMRKADAHLDFDLELAKSQAPENPVYYVQYCHARINSIMEFAVSRGVEVPDTPERGCMERLALKEEIDIIKKLAEFEEVIERSALDMEPHRLTFYLMELAGLFHPYYNRHRVVTDDVPLTTARLSLCRAVMKTIAKGLNLLGVSAPEKM